MRRFATLIRRSRASRRRSSPVRWVSPKNPSTKTTIRRFRALPRCLSPSRAPDMGGIRGALAALLLVLAPAAARADERILHYLSDVRIQKDSSIEVTETIDLRAENDRIN